MFSQIRTSKENKEVVSQLTRRLNLGTENVRSRIAIAYSLSKDIKLNISDLQNSSGKEYSKNVLFGDNYETYLGMICTHYNIYKTDKDIPKFIKLHLDNGLELISLELNERPNVDGFDFLIEKIGADILNI